MSTPKNSVVKNLIEAHSWLGLIISVLLFLVFWAGAISLFRAEIQQWAELPHHPVDRQAIDKPLFDIIDNKLAEYSLNTEEHLSIVMPDEHRPYYSMAIDLLAAPNAPKDTPEQVVQIKIDPKTGETVNKVGQFTLAGFIYKLHFDLNLGSVGNYLIGFVTLYFLFAILSGVVIHAKKLFPRFFAYRTHKKRTQLLDLHNVVGVMSLPFTLMYAISGLVFNLLIIYQIIFVVFLYQGDTNSLLKDAGFTIYQADQQTGMAQDMAGAATLIEQVADNYGPVRVARFYNYGDETAALELFGRQPDYFAQPYHKVFRVSDGELLLQYDNDHSNIFREGLDVLASLHFGNFAGLDLRILYFVLALAVAAMILAGNFLWVNKRSKDNSASPRAITFVGSMTIGSCSGFIVATAMAFFVERFLPAALEDRGSYIVPVYCVGLALTVVAAFVVRNKIALLSYVLWASAAVLLITVVGGWLLFNKAMISLVSTGDWVVVGVDIGLVMFSVFSIWVGWLVNRNQQRSAGLMLAAD